MPNLSRIAPALPVTSLFLGIGPSLLLAGLCALHMPPYLAAMLAVASSAIMTGAMAEDAIADSADGLFGGRTIERRLEILKDSRHGTYGVIALVTYIMVRVLALGAIAALFPLVAAALWLAAGILARSGSLWLTLRLPPARPDGAAAAAGRVSHTTFWIGMGVAIILAFFLAAPFTTFLGFAIAIVILGLISVGWARLCVHMVGGQTGDLIGGLHALLEIAALSAFIIFVGA